MTEKKMTKREYFTRILSYVHDEDKEFIEHEIALLDKKNSTERTWMESDKLYAVADITKGVPSLEAEGVSGNRVTALLKQLKDAGKVVRTEVKGKAFYSLA